MLRNIFVFLIIAAGVFHAFYGPFYLLLFYLWNAYFRPEDWVWGGGIAAELALSYILGVAVVVTTFFSSDRWRFNSRVVVFALFVLQTVVSTIASEHVEASWNVWLEFSKVLLISYLIVVLVNDRARLRLTLVVIALSLGFESAKQGWAQLFLNPGAQNNNPISFLGDNNGVAVGTLMLVPVFSALAQTAPRRWEKFIHRFLQFGVFMRGITTYSRGGFAAAAVLAILTLVRSPRKFRALIGIALVVYVVASVMPSEFWDRMRTINAPTEELDDSALGRLHFWDVARAMAAAKPLTGVGFSGYQLSYQAYNWDERFEGDRATHSVWFGILAELGYPGFVLFVGLIGLGIWSCLRVEWAAKRGRVDAVFRPYAVALSDSLIIFAVGGSFLSDQYNEMLWHFIGLTTALHLIATSRPDEVPVPVTVPAVQPRRALARSL